MSPWKFGKNFENLAFFRKYENFKIFKKITRFLQTLIIFKIRESGY